MVGTYYMFMLFKLTINRVYAFLAVYLLVCSFWLTIQAFSVSYPFWILALTGPDGVSGRTSPAS